MSQLSSLTIVLLNLLADKNYSGYDLTKVAYSAGWQASHQQVYRELGRLEKQGLIKHQKIVQSSSPDLKMQSITAAGRAALRKLSEQEEYKLSRFRHEHSPMYALGSVKYFATAVSTLTKTVDYLKRRIDKLQLDDGDHKEIKHYELELAIRIVELRFAKDALEEFEGELEKEA